MKNIKSLTEFINEATTIVITKDGKTEELSEYMFFDETSEEYGNPNLDYDLDSDGVIQEDMVVDYLRHTSFNEIKNSIKLKK
jgi:hypothetical protein